VSNAGGRLRVLSKQPARVRAAHGRVLFKVRLVKAVFEASTDPKQRRTLSSALQIFKKRIRAERRRSARAGEDINYQQTLLMIEHECDLDAPLGG